MKMRIKFYTPSEEDSGQFLKCLNFTPTYLKSMSLPLVTVVMTTMTWGTPCRSPASASMKQPQA